MKSKEKSTAAVLGVMLGVIFVVLTFGFLTATFVTFVVGLFVVFPLTLINVLKVWAGLVAFSVVVSWVKGK